MFVAEEKIVLGEPPFDDVHALTGSLKLYFRELPEPLIPYDFFSGFVEAISESRNFSFVIFSAWIVLVYLVLFCFIKFNL